MMVDAPDAPARGAQEEAMHIQPYIYFEGRCEEAIEFYRKALGAELVMMLRNREIPEPQEPGRLPPGSEDKVCHAAVQVGESLLLFSDGSCRGEPDFQGFSLTLNADDPAEIERWFAALLEGGEVRQPLTTTFFSPRFGMVQDRFGMLWTLVAAQEES
jgi:PhnB protein